MPRPGRTIAIGDIHGCSLALDALIAAIAPGPADTLVPLGDYIDRGPDSRGVVDRLLALDGRCRLIPILGNHDQMLLDVLADPRQVPHWLLCGGEATLRSYGVESPEEIPEAHVDFLRSCLDYFETGSHIFTHASYDPGLRMRDQPPSLLRWESIRDAPPGPHASGRVAVVGHTSQKDGEVLDLGYLVCIDTYCYGGRWLTALDVGSGQAWQANARGEIRGDRGPRR